MKLIKQASRIPFIRFGMVGVCGYAVDASMLWLGTRYLTLDDYSARVLAIFVAMFVTWLGNRYLTFSAHAARGSVKAIVQEWMKFVGANLIGALINLSTYSALIYAAPAPLNNIFIAQICGVLVGMIFNFFLSKHFVFSTRKD